MVLPNFTYEGFTYYDVTVLHNLVLREDLPQLERRKDQITLSMVNAGCSVKTGAHTYNEVRL